MTTHGQRNSRAYRIWHGMKTRCLNVNEHSYPRYGGQGVTISEDWMKFENFFRDMGHPPEKYTIERLSNDLGYSKENCVWADHATQVRNRRNAVKVTIGDETMIVWDWCQRNGIKPATAYFRIKSGWDPRIAVTKPSRKITLAKPSAKAALGAKP